MGEYRSKNDMKKVFGEAMKKRDHPFNEYSVDKTITGIFHQVEVTSETEKPEEFKNTKESKAWLEENIPTAPFDQILSRDEKADEKAESPRLQLEWRILSVSLKRIDPEFLEANASTFWKHHRKGI